MTDFAQKKRAYRWQCNTPLDDKKYVCDACTHFRRSGGISSCFSKIMLKNQSASDDNLLMSNTNLH